MRSSWLRAAFVAATVAWAAMLPLVPWLASRAHASAFGTAVVVLVYGAGHLICHQLPERSYQLWTAQMPVCARCTGIYVGAAFAAVVAYAWSAPLTRRPATSAHRSNRASIHAAAGRRVSGAGGTSGATRARVILSAAAAPTIFTLLYEWITGVTPSNFVRFAAGLPIGAAAAWLVVAATRAGARAENQVN